jgi:hypothetical protein
VEKTFLQSVFKEANRKNTRRGKTGNKKINKEFKEEKKDETVTVVVQTEEGGLCEEVGEKDN